jgi:hypothetical protein
MSLSSSLSENPLGASPPFAVADLGVAKEFQPAVDEFFRDAPARLLVGRGRHSLPFYPPLFFTNCQYWRLAVEGGQEVKEVLTGHDIDPSKDTDFQKAWLMVNGFSFPLMVVAQKNEYLDYLMYGNLKALPEEDGDSKVAIARAKFHEAVQKGKKERKEESNKALIQVYEACSRAVKTFLNNDDVKITIRGIDRRHVKQIQDAGFVVTISYEGVDVRPKVL